SWVSAIGVSAGFYHWFAATAGTVAAVLVIAGVVVLALRRLLVARVRAATTGVDYLALILLLVLILTGIAPTLWNFFGEVNLFVAPHDYRHTISPWFRGLFSFNPEVATVVTAPFVFKLHAVASWLIWAVWPFTRLVHAWSYPLWYLW